MSWYADTINGAREKKKGRGGVGNRGGGGGAKWGQWGLRGEGSETSAEWGGKEGGVPSGGTEGKEKVVAHRNRKAHG